MRVLVFNGWAAGPEAWLLTTFPRDWTFSYIEELDGLPDRVMNEFDEVVLVGFSMGGSMALGTFLKYPQKVKGLVLVSATPCMIEKKEDGWIGMGERRFRAFSLGTELLFGSDSSPWYDPKQMERGLDYLMKTDLRFDLENLVRERADLIASIPVRIFHSISDGIVRPSNAAYLKSLFPRAIVTMIEGSEHVLPITIPDQIDAAVKEVLAELEMGHEA